MCMLQISSQSELSLEKVYEQFGGFEIDSLKSIANSTVRMKFLKVFSQAQQFIEWLQRETKSKLHCMLMLYKHLLGRFQIKQYYIYSFYT